MSQGETWTTRRLLEWTTNFFTEKGADSPRLEAEILLAFALKTTRVNLYVNYDSVPNDDERALFRSLVKRRGAKGSVSS
jgi:release factor glutamine methyltransferase